MKNLQTKRLLMTKKLAVVKNPHLQMMPLQKRKPHLQRKRPHPPKRRLPPQKKLLKILLQLTTHRLMTRVAMTQVVMVAMAVEMVANKS